ncbi:MAG: hypothetical protein ABR583_08035 [Gaiellaceae bacterium]
MKLRAAVLVLGAAFLASCGSGGSGSGGSPEDQTIEEAGNPRVATMITCLGDEGGGSAYELQENAVSLNTEMNGVEIYFDKTENAAKKRERETKELEIGVAYRHGTVLEAWVSPPTPAEREPVTKCIAKDPGP